MFPAERALIESHNAHIDGVMNRIKGHDTKYSNLVRIATAICYNTYALFMLKENALNAQLDFNNIQLGIKRGNIPLELSFEQYNPYKATS